MLEAQIVETQNLSSNEICYTSPQELFPTDFNIIKV